MEAAALFRLMLAALVVVPGLIVRHRIDPEPGRGFLTASFAIIFFSYGVIVLELLLPQYERVINAVHHMSYAAAGVLALAGIVVLFRSCRAEARS